MMFDTIAPTTFIERSVAEKGEEQPSSESSVGSPPANGYSSSPSALSTLSSRTYVSTLNDSSEHTLLDEKQRKVMSKQFKSKITLSTLICTLIVAYVGFLNTTAIDRRKCIASSTLRDLGLLLALLAITLHAIVITLSSQQSSLCDDPAVHCRSEDCQNSLAVCNIIQFGGSVLFILAVMESSCLFFENYPYFVSFIVISSAGLVAFFFANWGLWKFYSDLARLIHPKRSYGAGTQDPEAQLSVVKELNRVESTVNSVKSSLRRN